jgi:hypothetical protein
MPYPHITQFEDVALRDQRREQLRRELEATRGRSTWRAPRRPQQRAPRFSALFSRA